MDGKENNYENTFIVSFLGRGQLKAMQDVLTVDREDNRAMRDSWVAYNAQMQVFMMVRKKYIHSFHNI
jgi:hypothetical protein